MLHLVVSIYLRLEHYHGGNWDLWVPALVSAVSLILFVIYLMDEDEEALDLQSRPYSTQAVIKASPGSHRD